MKELNIMGMTMRVCSILGIIGTSLSFPLFHSILLSIYILSFICFFFFSLSLPSYPYTSPSLRDLTIYNSFKGSAVILVTYLAFRNSRTFGTTLIFCLSVSDFLHELFQGYVSLAIHSKSQVHLCQYDSLKYWFLFLS